MGDLDPSRAASEQRTSQNELGISQHGISAPMRRGIRPFRSPARPGFRNQRILPDLAAETAARQHEPFCNLHAVELEAWALSNDIAQSW